MRPNSRFLPPLILVGVLTLAFGVTSAFSAITIGDGSYVPDMPLSKPTTIRPAAGAALQYPTDPIKLAWRPVPGASKYHVQVAQQASSSADCNSASAWATENILFTHETTEVGWVPEMLDEASGSRIWTGTFCWRVRAAGKTPAGTWSSGSKFTVSWPAQATSLKFFSDESGDVPRTGSGDATGFDTGYLEWSAVTGASRYEVQISESPTFSQQSIFASKIYPGNRMLLPTMPDNNYSWRVRPIAGNGVYGSWSSIATFTIQRDIRYWSDASTMYPAQGATTSDLRIGWEPVPGASYYRYMAARDSAIFPELENLGPYGIPDADCSGAYLNSRLSATKEADSSTINNWVTMAGLIDPAVVANLATYCEQKGSPGVFHRPPFDGTIHWRVYPVWQLSAATETGWPGIATAKIVGSEVQRSFALAEYTAAEPADPTIGMVNSGNCEGLPCLRTIGGSMSPLNPSINSTTMQVPYFQWGAYEGAFNAGPGAFRVDIARDSSFNNRVYPPSASNNKLRGWISALGPARFDAWAASSVGMSRFGGYHSSFALTTGLADEGQDGNGYFWRSLPCESGDYASKENFHMGYVCGNVYTDAVGVGQSPGIVFGTPGSGALEFRKRVEVSTAVIDNFTAAMPMLKVGPVGASTYSEWQRGIQGADHYQFELARNQAFDDATVYKTTVPRLVPWGATPSDVLEPGTWFWRVRAVDRDGLTGTWSSTSSFSLTAPAPTVSSESDTSGVGATVQWSPVVGAIEYEIQWASNDGFSDATTKQTKQTAYHIPSAAAGAYVWRVRAKMGKDAYGAWTSARDVTILDTTRIPYGVSAPILNVGAIAIVEGQLIVGGAATNGQTLTLQRKATSCDGSGSYSAYASATSGLNLDDGYVRLRIRVNRNACYRFAWAYSTGTIYSAPFAIGARPVVTFTPRSRTVRRGRPFCSLITSRTPITGRLRIEYKLGRRWLVARTQQVSGMRRRTQCAAINRGGVFPVRLVLDNMVHPTGGWELYSRTTKANGTVRTNDSFSIVR